MPRLTTIFGSNRVAGWSLSAPRHSIWLLVSLIASLLLAGCGGSGEGDSADTGVDAEGAATVSTPDNLPNGLLLSVAALDKDADGKIVTLPAHLEMLVRKDGDWAFSILTDEDSNVFHKAMAYGDQGILTLGGTRAIVKLWQPDGSSEVLWEKDFGGKFSRMRDAEVGDLDGDGDLDIAVATHDQGVVAIISPDASGGWSVEEIDAEADIIVHEIEIGDLDGDGTPEVYATPTEPNRLDGTAQAGVVVRYTPAADEGRTVVADLGDRHAKEILVDDVDGDGRDELYVSVEAVSGGKVEVRRYDAGDDPTAQNVIATIDDSLTRFLTAGDIDGDGKKEMVAAATKSGLFLLRPSAEGEWSSELIDDGSGGFEHAAILTDLDGDGRDELYVASDDHDEVNRYVYENGAWQKDLLTLHLDGLSRFTWNIMPAPVGMLPPGE